MKMCFFKLVKLVTFLIGKPVLSRYQTVFYQNPAKLGNKAKIRPVAKSPDLTVFASLGTYPFDGKNMYKLFENISLGKYTIPHSCPNLTSLLHGLLEYKAEKRFTIQEIKNHE